MPKDASTPLLIHFHIPRTGGTTVGRMLKLRILSWPPSRWLHHSQALGFHRITGWENRIRRIDALPERAKRRVRLFEAHAGYGLHELLPEPSIYLTMIREPIDRAVSAFFYIRRKGLIPPDSTIESFIDRGDFLRIWWLDNAYVRFLAGERGSVIDVPPGQVTRIMFDTAMERLENAIDFVGLMERFDESMVLLRRVLNWPHCHYIPSKANPDRQRLADLPDATLSRLRDLNEFDLALHERARALVEERIEREGASFGEELARFREANARYGRRMARIDSIIKWRRSRIARKTGLGRSE